MQRTNLFPCPLFTGAHGKAANSDDCKLTYKGSGQLVMSPLSDESMGGWCDFVVPVSAGAYVASVGFQFADGADDFRGSMLSVFATDAYDSNCASNSDSLIAELDNTHSVGRRVLRFTVPDGVSYVCLRFRGSKSRDVWYRNPQVELASTYDAAVNAGGTPILFNGDTMPKIQ